MVGRGGAQRDDIFVNSSDVSHRCRTRSINVYAPVITMSYGLCEGSDLVDLPSERQTAQQANAEGITWLNAAGDDGAADCEDVERHHRPGRFGGGRPGERPGSNVHGRHRI